MSLLVDSHAHLDDDAFAGDLDDVLGRARAAGVAAILVPGTDAASSRAAAALAGTRAGVRLYAAVGVHPHEAALYDGAVEAEIEALARRPGVVAIGEIGLDFHRGGADRAAQGEAFRRQLALARRLGLPAVVHCRAAEAEALSALEEARLSGGVMHCWCGSAEGAARAAAMGLGVSFAGVVAFEKADALRAVAARVPAEALLVETDAPYLAPPPHRGRRCEPAHVAETVRALAAARGETPEAVAATTSANARRLLGLAP